MSAPYKVLVIESSTTEDKDAGRTEQHVLGQIFHLLGVRAKIVAVGTKAQFFSAMKKAASEHILYVHFSGHGAPDGIAIGDDEFISWEEFDEGCWPNLKHTNLSFSSCDVAQGVEELFAHHKTFCASIVAPTRRILWSEGAVAYASFFLKATGAETSTDQDVRVMNHICGAGTFKVMRGKETASAAVLS